MVAQTQCRIVFGLLGEGVGGIGWLCVLKTTQLPNLDEELYYTLWPRLHSVALLLNVEKKGICP